MKSRRLIQSPCRLPTCGCSLRAQFYHSLHRAGRAKLHRKNGPTSAFRISTVIGTGSDWWRRFVSAISGWAMFITTYSTNDRLWHKAVIPGDSVNLVAAKFTDAGGGD